MIGESLTLAGCLSLATGDRLHWRRLEGRLPLVRGAWKVVGWALLALALVAFSLELTIELGVAYWMLWLGMGGLAASWLLNARPEGVRILLPACFGLAALGFWLP